MSWVLRSVLNVLISWCVPSKIISGSLPFVSKTLKNYPNLFHFFFKVDPFAPPPPGQVLPWGLVNKVTLTIILSLPFWGYTVAIYQRKTVVWICAVPHSSTSRSSASSSATGSLWLLEWPCRHRASPSHGRCHWTALA